MMIIGVDEAGRGPLAGPVVAAAVVLHADHTPAGLADSKQLSAQRRSALASIIQRESLAYGVGWASVEEIDAHNILQATFLAMSRAVQECLERLSAARGAASNVEVHVAGNRAPTHRPGHCEWPYTTRTFIKGDQTQPSISAASILAKTARDAEMHRLHGLYPVYQFNRHAGYGTAVHMKALEEFGASPVHRVSFAPVARVLARRPSACSTSDAPAP